MNCPNCKIELVKRETETHNHHECSVCHYSMADKKYIAIGKPKTEKSNNFAIQTSDIKNLLIKMADDDFSNKFSILMQGTMKHFHQYSLRNMFWIIWQSIIQNREVSLVNSATRWKELKRTIKKEEINKSLFILRPNIKKWVENGEKKERLIGFVNASVYDYQQTEGEEIVIDNKAMIIDNPESVYNTLVNKLEKKGFTVTVKPVESLSKGGSIDKEKNITLSSFRTVSNHICTLLHEYSHFLCGHLEEKYDYFTNRQTAEIEAELSAFVFGMSIGLVKGSYEYISNWVEGDFNLITDDIVKKALKTAQAMQKDFGKELGIKE